MKRLKPKKEISPINQAKAIHKSGNSKYTSLDYIGAIQDYTKAIQLYPDGADYYYSRAIANVQINNHFVAINDLSKAIDLSPVYYYFIVRAITREKVNDFAGAIQDYTKVMELCPVNVNFF